jgi:spermidine synthase
VRDDLSPRTRAVVVAIFLLSGVSGLVYQVIWVRQFGNVFGNTVQSASLVAGVFMAGLGGGAYFLGREADARHADDPIRSLRLYAGAELGIATWGLGLALLLPRLRGLSAIGSSYVTGEHGWHELSSLSYVLRYVVAIALVAPPAFLMGGTLTLLVRFVVAHRLDDAALRIGQLYAANTTGAALGALLTDLVLVPSVGIFSTQLVAVALNTVAGVSAFALARLTGPHARVPTTCSLDPATAPSTPGHTHLLASAIALAFAGFAAMGLEILWFRCLSSVLGELRAVFSLLLAVILTGIGLGALVGSALHRRVGRPALLWMGSEALLAAVVATLLGFVDARAVASTHDLVATFAAASPWERTMLEVWASVRPIAVFVFVPAVLMGMSFPLANANVQRAVTSVGRRAGLLYLANTVGNVLGCGVVGFILLPLVGAQRTTLILAGCAAASILPIYLSARPFVSDAEARAAQVALAASSGVAVVALGAFAALPHDWMLERTLPHDRLESARQVLALSEGLTETLAVTEVPDFFRELLTNGHPMSSTHPKSQRYMRAFAHVPLLMLDEPREALVICFGVGNTTHAASLHPSMTRIDVADLSRGVLEHAGWFQASNGDVLLDPRVSVFVNDGRNHLLMEPAETYDLITLEPPPIAFAGVASLYSREFYELARSRLTPRGFITQWLPAYQVPEERVRSAVRAFVDVFPESVLLSGDDNELILMGTRGPSIQLDLAAVGRRLEEEPAVLADLTRVDLGNLTEIAGMFAASHATLARATDGVVAVTDDRPSLEYSLVSGLGERRMPADLFDVSDVDAWCPSCAAELPGLAPYLRVRSLVYASDSFLVTPGPTSVGGLAPSALRDAASALAASHYLNVLVHGASLQAREAGARSRRAGRTAQAITLLELALSDDPRDAEAFAELGRALSATGDDDGAAGAFQRSVAIDPKNATTHCELAAALRRMGVLALAAEEERGGALLGGRPCGDVP